MSCLHCSGLVSCRLWLCAKLNTVTGDMTSGAGIEPVTGDVTSGAGMEPVMRDVTSGAGMEPVTGDVTSGAGMQPVTGDVTSGAGIEPVMRDVTSGAGTEPVTGDVTSGAGMEPVTGDVTSGAGMEPVTGDMTSGAGMEPVAENDAKPAAVHAELIFGGFHDTSFRAFPRTRGPGSGSGGGKRASSALCEVSCGLFFCSTREAALEHTRRNTHAGGGRLPGDDLGATVGGGSEVEALVDSDVKAGGAASEVIGVGYSEAGAADRFWFRDSSSASGSTATLEAGRRSPEVTAPSKCPGRWPPAATMSPGGPKYSGPEHVDGSLVGSVKVSAEVTQPASVLALPSGPPASESKWTDAGLLVDEWTTDRLLVFGLAAASVLVSRSITVSRP